MSEEEEKMTYIDELSIEQLKDLVKGLDKTDDKIIVLKFYADWCGPCKRVAPICDEAFNNMGESVIKIIIDIDEQLDLYMFLKRKRIITGIPCTLAWNPKTDRDYDLWYHPDDSVLSSDENDTIAFFERVKEKASK